MKPRTFLITCSSLLVIFVLQCLPVWAVPLSLQENIKAIVSNQTGSTERFDFVVIGDNRKGTEAYQRLLTLAKGFKPLFILNTGDFVNRGQSSEYDEYSKQIVSCTIPILHVLGNHDGSDSFRKYMGEPNWYLDVGKVRIVGLDNGSGEFTPEAVAFARETLTENKICLVTFHMPPSVGRLAVHAMDPKSVYNSQVIDLIEKAKVPAVFLGHIHLYDEMEINGTNYIISAGGGARLYGSGEFGKPEHGLVLVRVRPEGITHQWVPLP